MDHFERHCAIRIIIQYMVDSCAHQRLEHFPYRSRRLWMRRDLA